MCACFSKFYQQLINLGSFLQSFFLLAIRLFWGWQFLKTGVGKLSDIETIATYFGTLGFPAPLLNAYLAAGIETVGGLCLILGFASRLAAIPLIVTMIVALLMAHREATLMIFENPVALIGTTPFSFLMAGLIVFVFGPGKFSFDESLGLFRNK